MTKIAFVSTMEGVPWGGSEELWSQAALRMAQQKFDVGVNVLRWPVVPRRLAAIQEAGGHITRRSRPTATVQKLLRRLSKETPYHWLDHFRPDFVVVSQGANLDGVGWMLECAKRHIPYVSIAQATNENEWPAVDLVERAIEAHCRAKACFFVSQGNLELTQRQLAYTFANARIVRNPFNVSYEASPEWPDQEGWKLACVGRLSPSAKGQDILFEVLSLPKWRERPLHTVLYGDGPNEQTLRALCQMLALQNVSFGGFVTDIEQMWRGRHALILPSRYEGLPLAVVEAMLCGRPCIVTNVPGNAELIVDGESGFIAAAPRASCLDEAMERAWQARENWRQIGQAASERVRTLVPRDPVGVFVAQITALISA